MLEAGIKLLVAHRRLFEKDEPRYFVGRVEEYDSGLVKMKGHTFVRDVMTGNFVRKNEERIKILSIASGSYLVYQLPDDADLDGITFELHQSELVLSDGKGLKMNMAETPHRGEI